MRTSVAALVEAFFQFKHLSSISLLLCWPPRDLIRISRHFSSNGLLVMSACGSQQVGDVFHLMNNKSHLPFGVILDTDRVPLDLKLMVECRESCTWLLVGENAMEALDSARGLNPLLVEVAVVQLSKEDRTTLLLDGVTKDVLAEYSECLFKPLNTRTLFQRRQNMRGARLRIVVPIGDFSGPRDRDDFHSFLVDSPHGHAASKVAYTLDLHIADFLNLTATLEMAETFNRVNAATGQNTADSMLGMVASRGGPGPETDDMLPWEMWVAGSGVRITRHRVETIQFFTQSFPFRSSFVYLSTGGSLGGFVPWTATAAPFSSRLWSASLATFILMAFALTLVFKKGFVHGLFSAFALFSMQGLDVDGSTGGARLATRLAVLSACVCALVLHSHYACGALSARLQVPRGGPKTLRQLADSPLTLHAEDIDYAHWILFDTSDDPDLRYLSAKKKHKGFYVNLEEGMQYLKEGHSMHTEIIRILPYLARLSIDNICRIKMIDAIPRVELGLSTTMGEPAIGSLKVAAIRLREHGQERRQVRVHSGGDTVQLLGCQSSGVWTRAGQEAVAAPVAILIVGTFLAFVLLIIENLHKRCPTRFNSRFMQNNRFYMKLNLNKSK